MQLYVGTDTNAYPLLKTDGNNYISIKGGRYVNNIEFRHLPVHVVDELDDYQKDDIKNHQIYVIYLARVYYKLEAREVSPEKSEKYFI